MKSVLARSGWGAPLAALLVLQTGCAGFGTGFPPEDRAWPPAPGSAQLSISISVAGRFSVDGKPEPLFQTSHENWARTCRGTYRSSGLFSDVRSDGEHADLSAAVEVSVDKTFSKEMALAWEFTLMLVPCTENYQFTVRTTFRDEVGHIRGAVEKHGTVVVWNEMLLMFVAPFSSPKGTEEAVLERLGRSTLLDAMEKGYVGP